MYTVYIHKESNFYNKLIKSELNYIKYLHELLLYIDKDWIQG